MKTTTTLTITTRHRRMPLTSSVLTFSCVFGLSQVPDNEDEWRSEESGQQKLSVINRTI